MEEHNSEVLQLEDLLSGQGESIEKLIEQLSACGFCFVHVECSQLPRSTLSKLKEDVKSFFSEPQSSKETFSDVYLGYSTTQHKEGYRVLTSAGGPTPSPESCPKMKVVHEVSKVLDSLIVRIIENLESVFGSAEGLGSLHEILLCTPSRVGLLDVAHYTNKEEIIEVKSTNSEINCSEHVDPGLISLNLFSTSPGLQFFDPRTASWREPPSFTSEEGRPITGVLWCGDAASKITDGKIKAANHRVIFGEEPRYTIWYEAIHKSQIAESVIKALPEKKSHMEAPTPKMGAPSLTSRQSVSPSGNSASASGNSASASGQSPPPIDYSQAVKINCKTLTGRLIPLTVLLGDTGYRLKERVQEKEGIPPSKNRIIFSGRVIRDEDRLGDIKIKEGSMVHLVLALRP
jgi:isopenicillin N synthase-like dioxygenase